jgi:SAM-dependent methyltransferase
MELLVLVSVSAGDFVYSRMNAEPADILDDDRPTATAFAASWNHLPPGSVYTRAQVEDWFAPLTPDDLRGRTVLELGCGNGSLLVHVAAWKPRTLTGVDLGDSVRSARANLAATGFERGEIVQADLTTFCCGGFDVVYCIGVLHHLKRPEEGFRSVVANVRPGGRFHCWVYAREGNGVIVWLVDPLRRLTSRLPWWFTKYCVATPLALPYFAYAKVLATLPRWAWLRRLPLYEYSLWIAERTFSFFRHVAFDQLVTPQTTYVSRAAVNAWLAAIPEIDAASTYVLFRNGNSWKFGGRTKDDLP